MCRRGPPNRALGIDHSRAAVHDSDRLVRTLGTLARVHRQHGRVAFEQEDHAARFARDLQGRYGAGIMAEIAAGDTSALARDIPEAAERRAIALALLAAAKSHESLGLSRRQAELAKERLLARAQDHDRPPHARRKDHDLDL